MFKYEYHTHSCVASAKGLFIETITCLKTFDTISLQYIQHDVGEMFLLQPIVCLTSIRIIESLLWITF